MRYSGTSANVLSYFTNRPGLVIHVSEIVEGTGLTATQVQRALTYLRPKLGDSLITVVRGHSWRYMPTATPTSDPKPTAKVKSESVVDVKPTKIDTPHEAPLMDSRVFHEVGRMTDRSIIVKDARGNLYKVVPL